MAAVLARAAFEGVKEHYKAVRAKERLEAAQRERVCKAVEAVNTCKFPACLVSFSDFKRHGRFLVHEEVHLPPRTHVAPLNPSARELTPC